MKNPDSTAPAEEAEGVGEVLEVRKRVQGAREGRRAEGPAEPPSHPSPQFDYEYTELGERLVLGKGTYGVVYAGRDRHTRVRIAIKEIPERDSRFGDRGRARPAWDSERPDGRWAGHVGGPPVESVRWEGL